MMRHGYTLHRLVQGMAVGGLIGGTALLLMGQVAVGPSLTASGKIASIDAEQRVLKLKTGFFATREFMIEADTRISDGRQSISLEQLQPEPPQGAAPALPEQPGNQGAGEQQHPDIRY